MELELKSPGFSSFRPILDIWDQYLLEEENSNSIRHFLDLQGIVLFFKKGKDYFGATEDSRVIFARLKNPSDETSDGWEDEANFTATNLTKMVKGEPSDNVFDKEDIKEIRVVDQEKAISALASVSADAGKKFQPLKIMRSGNSFIHKDRDDAPNFVRTDEV